MTSTIDLAAPATESKWRNPSHCQRPHREHEPSQPASKSRRPKQLLRIGCVAVGVCRVATVALSPLQVKATRWTSIVLPKQCSRRARSESVSSESDHDCRSGPRHPQCPLGKPGSARRDALFITARGFLRMRPPRIRSETFYGSAAGLPRTALHTPKQLHCECLQQTRPWFKILVSSFNLD